MSYNENDGTTTTIEKPTTSILDLIDERVAQNSVPEQTEIEREVARFDNSHSAINLHRAYDDIDRANYQNQYQSQVRNIEKKQVDIVSNPFFGDSEVLHKMRKKSQYSDVVNMPTENPTLEIKSVEKEVAKPQLSARKKMWLVTGACCCVLLLALVICNIFSIGALENDLANGSADVIRQEAELDALNGSITNNSGTVPEGMQGAGAGTSVDIAPNTPTEITPSDNFFNRFAEFISYIFGK